MVKSAVVFRSRGWKLSGPKKSWKCPHRHWLLCIDLAFFFFCRMDLRGYIARWRPRSEDEQLLKRYAFCFFFSASLLKSEWPLWVKLPLSSSSSSSSWKTEHPSPSTFFLLRFGSRYLVFWKSKHQNVPAWGEQRTAMARMLIWAESARHTWNTGIGFIDPDGIIICDVCLYFTCTSENMSIRAWALCAALQFVALHIHKAACISKAKKQQGRKRQ